jgi:large subunit ribosomal protein L22
MGVRKRTKAEETKEAKKQMYYAKLNNCPTSPRKMRLVADLVRGISVDRALHILKHNSKQPSAKLEKLLLSAISNWQQKNEGVRIEDSNLVVKNIFVDSGRVLKRILPAPQGRAHRMKKRSNHVTLVLGSMDTDEVIEEAVTEGKQSEPEVTAEVTEKKTRKSTKKTK